MSDPRAVQGILDATVPRLDDIGRNGADKRIERLGTDRVDHAFAHLLGIKTRRGEAFGQCRFFVGTDLRPAQVAGRLRAPRGIFVLTGPGHSTETLTLVPS